MTSLKIRAGEFAILAGLSVSENAVGAWAGEGHITDAFPPFAEASSGKLIHITFDPALAHAGGWRTEQRID